MGIWEVKVYHFEKIDADEGIAIAFKVSDEDAKRGLLPKVFERAVNAVKKRY